MAKGQYQIPFDSEGNQKSYMWQDSIMKDNYIFEETMTYDGYGRGRSSATILFQDSKGKHYYMFLSDFDKVLRTKGLVGASIHAKWTFCKKGSNYGLTLAD